MPALFGLLFFSFFYDKAILSLVLPAFFPIPAACSLVLTSLASCILKTPMEAYDPRGKDFLVWLHSKSGLLTSKSAYIAIHSQENAASTSSSEENIQTFAKLWKVKRFSPRVIVFMWRCLSEAIPTNVRRSRHISSIDYSCPICHEDRETTEHLFLRCNMARAVWFGSHFGWRPSGSNLSFSEIVKSWLDDPRLFCFQVLQFNVLGFVEGKMQAGHGGHPY